MAYVNQNAEIYAGDSKEIDITIYDENGTDELGLSGYDVYYHVYESSGNPVITKTSDDDVEKLSGGKIVITFNPSDTEDMFGEYKHEIDIINETDVHTVLTGKLTISESVATGVRE